jgi:tripartite-type tricarboxylate transporter receptor subunit TctC
VGGKSLEIKTKTYWSGTMKIKTILAAALLASGLGVTGAHAEYPEKPITMIIPFAAGGGTDATGRTIARFLEKHLGQPVAVINRPGAGGEIGLAEVAKSAPDGYTIGLINTPGIVTVPIEREAQFKIEDFTFIAGMVEDPATLSVLGSSDIKSIEDLVAAAKAKPGAVTVGTQGVGSAGHIAMMLFENAAGIDLLPIPFDGASTGRNALMSGEIQVTSANLGEAMTFAEGTDWRILGVMSSERSAMAPDVPSFAEAGYPAIGGSIRGLGAPAGLPEDVLAKLAAAVDAVAKDPEYLQLSKRTFQPIRYIKPDDYAKILAELDASSRDLWTKSPWNQ